MSYRKIEKLWDELREAQKPKRNLSKQPKKREVKLNKIQDLNELITIAYDSEKVTDEMNEVMEAIDNFLAKVTGKMTLTFKDYYPEDFKGYAVQANEEFSDIQRVNKELGMSFDDLDLDYSEASVEKGIAILEEIANAIENYQMAIDDLETLVKKSR